ncbi:MAG: preprotein translocase subunit SecY [Nitrososphaerales archaeon]
MSAFRSLVKSIATVLPEVPKPTRKPSFNEKLIWTGIALVVYLVMGQIPLYGVAVGGQDPLAFSRVIFASQRGTLMELGIGPIVTAGLILQLLKGSQIIKLDFKKPEDRALFSSATKILTLIVILVEASTFIMSGIYGQNLSIQVISILLSQLLVAGILVILLDELIQKGWGLGSGVSLFIMAGVAQQVLWNLFSIIPTGEGPLGIIPYIIDSAIKGTMDLVLFRHSNLPSLFGLFITFAAILVIVYVEGIRIEIPITSTKYRGFQGTYPIKLLYVSNIPVILVSALTANFMFVSQTIWSNYNPGNSNTLLNLFVTYNATNPGAGPTGGLMYYITSPGAIGSTLQDPFRAVGYILYFVILSILFARIWVEIGGLSPKDVAKNLLGADVQVRGFRRSGQSVQAVLERYIPVITILGGMFIGLLASVSDILGTFGSGIGLLLMTSIILQYYQTLMKEQLETQMPRLAGILGKT